MAGRILNRRALRAQANRIEQSEATASDTALVAVPPKKPSKAKTPAALRVRTARAKKAPPRLRARWGVFDAGMKQVALFDYNQRGAADERLAKRKGTYVLQMVKEPMPLPAPIAAPSVE
jgi:hypothetical protein